MFSTFVRLIGKLAVTFNRRLSSLNCLRACMECNTELDKLFQVARFKNKAPPKGGDPLSVTSLHFHFYSKACAVPLFTIGLALHDNVYASFFHWISTAYP